MLLTIAKFLLPRRVDLRVWNVKKDTVMVSGDKEVSSFHYKQEHRRKVGLPKGMKGGNDKICDLCP